LHANYMPSAIQTNRPCFLLSSAAIFTERTHQPGGISSPRQKKKNRTKPKISVPSHCACSCMACVRGLDKLRSARSCQSKKFRSMYGRTFRFFSTPPPESHAIWSLPGMSLLGTSMWQAFGAGTGFSLYIHPYRCGESSPVVETTRLHIRVSEAGNFSLHL